MKRRQLLVGMGALLLPFPVAARWVDETQLRNPNGHIGSDGRMHWINGGGQPLTLTQAEVMALPRIREFVPEFEMWLLYTRIGVEEFEVEDGHQIDVMFSGRGHAEHHVLAWPSRWRRGVSRKAWVRRFFDASGAQVHVIQYGACNNIGLRRIGAPLICRCEPGDLCVRS